jgi:TM2 domain-containing membrane protein YozV
MRRTKIAGLVAMAAGVPLASVPLDGASEAWLAAASRNEIALAAGLVYAGVNLFAGGLIVLLAALQGRSLAERHVRAGMLKKLAGVNLLIPAVAFAVTSDGMLESTLEDPVIAVPALVAFVVVARLGMRTLRAGWKYDAQPAADVLREDSRPPVLYLRSFRDDSELLVTSSNTASARITAALNYTVAFNPEQELALILDGVGPVVAIGRPGEPLPELGAAREYVADDRWRDTVDSYMRRASLVVIRAGATDSLWWEIERTLEQVPPQKVVIVSLGASSWTEAFDARFNARFGIPRPVMAAAGQVPAWAAWLLRTALNIGRPIGRVIYFDAGRTPFEIPIGFRMTLAGFALAPYRPYREALTATMTQVLAAQGLQWRRRRTQTAAVLLALFGGIIGAHQFYLGRRRRGWWYVAFGITGIPLLLGLVDGVRMALADRRGFDREFAGGHAAAALPTHAGSVNSASQSPS